MRNSSLTKLTCAFQLLWRCFGALFCCACLTFAQTETATISGLITDQSGRNVPNCEVVLHSVNQGTDSTVKSNDSGIYVFASVQPGPYNIAARRDGFKQVDLLGIIVNVQDHVEQNIQMQVGSVSESVTVEAGGLNINTTDASVSTVVDRQFVENIPLNGRSFQDLILLTPGIVTQTPQVSAQFGANGEFSVNGQRTESNYYTVDGVSANVGYLPGQGDQPGVTGSLAASTALGTTQALVGVDALEEFRVQSSTYSAEYGRNPGGQISFSTRSGTNQFHGSAFDYVRNGFFDANDWFTDYYKTPSAGVRQNDFGGTFGGPVEIPKVYDGKDKTFFFFSYEGLRLMQPQAATVTYSPDMALRQSAPTVLQPILNAFAIPNGRDLGNGLAEYVGTWSNPSSIDAYSIRVDQIVNDKLKLFFRFSETPSSSAMRISGYEPTSGITTTLTARTYTLGTVSTFSSRLSNDFRLNYTSNGGAISNLEYQTGGSTSVDLPQLMGIDKSTNPHYYVEFGLSFPGGYRNIIADGNQVGTQHQWNLVDTLSLSFGRHQLRFGGDFRRLTPKGVSSTPIVDFIFSNAAGVLGNGGLGVVLPQSPFNLLFQNFSAFVQDQWRVAPRLSLSMGLRWEVNPAPGATDGHVPYTVVGASLSTLALAPEGTPPWQTTWFNFAPRLGAAYLLRTTPGWETVIRAGGGVFLDTGQQLGSYGIDGPGFSSLAIYDPTPFPLTQAQLNVPLVNPPVAPYTSGYVYAYPKHLQLPYTWQWNSSIQQALGKSQSLTMSYVGSHGSRLLEENYVNVAPYNPNFGTVLFVQNGLTSDYDALQVQFQRKLMNGLTALASYTWSHCIDYGSENTSLPYVRGNCDFDVRNNISSVFSYNLSGSYENRFAHVVLAHWGLDDRFTARTGFPITLDGNQYLDPATGGLVQGGLDLVPGAAIYLYGSQYPGGRAINPAAFSLPPVSGRQQGDAPRNFVRGFGAWQMDLAVRREFPIYERLKLQFRAEAFNVFNHPNFGLINPYFGNVQFGIATSTLASSLGVLNPLYQQGGPRSMQLVLKLIF